MATLSQARMVGGVGSILAFIPFLNIIGLILILISINNASNSVKDRSIFNQAIIAVSLEIVGAVVGLFVFFASLASSLFTFGLSAIIGAFSGLAIAWVFLLISAIFLRRCYEGMASKLGVDSFRTAGTLYLVGAALLIAFGLGIIIIFVGLIFQAIAFFSIPDQPPTGSGGVPGPMAAPPPPMAPPGGATKFCTNCGNRIAASATFCNNCGAKQP
jgi:uncharacterized membrane protein